MDRPAPVLDALFLRHSTKVSNALMEKALLRALQFQQDPDRAQRLEQQLCKACFYRDVPLTQSACTTQPCACCLEVQQYGSRRTDVLCMTCAKQHCLCKHCASDIDMNLERTAWPTPAAAPSLR